MRAKPKSNISQVKKIMWKKTNKAACSASYNNIHTEQVPGTWTGEKISGKRKLHRKNFWLVKHGQVRYECVRMFSTVSL